MLQNNKLKKKPTMKPPANKLSTHSLKQCNTTSSQQPSAFLQQRHHTTTPHNTHATLRFPSTTTILTNKAKRPPTNGHFSFTFKHAPPPTTTTTTTTIPTTTNTITHTSKRNVSFVNATFQVVQVKVQSKLPELQLLLPSPQQHQNSDKSVYDQSTMKRHHFDDNDDGNGNSGSENGGASHKSAPINIKNTFLNPSILSNSQQLLNFARQQPVGTTFLVRKKDLSSFYDTTQQLHLKQQQQQSTGGIKNPLLLASSINPTTTTTTTHSDGHHQHKHHNDNDDSNPLSLFYQEQQIALQSAPKVKIGDLSSIENEKRREFYNSTNAKPLVLFKLPKKHEIQAILAASKGDLTTVKQIIGKSYHDLFFSMNLLPKRFIQQKMLDPQDWCEIKEDDIDIVYKPGNYQFFPSNDQLNDFFTWLQESFSPQTLESFRASSLYTYNIASQLQKGGSVLHHSCQNGKLNIVEFLLQHGSAQYINQQTSNNSTPLHWACGGGWLSIVKVLIEKYNADLHLTTNSWAIDVFGRDSGQLPIHWAAASGHSDIVDYLYSLSPITIGLKDEKDNSVVCVAKKGLHFDTIRRIQRHVDDDEYVPVKLDIHTIEHNVIVDHTQMKHQQQNGQQAQTGDDLETIDLSIVEHQQHQQQSAQNVL